MADADTIGVESFFFWRFSEEDASAACSADDCGDGHKSVVAIDAVSSNAVDGAGATDVAGVAGVAVAVDGSTMAATAVNGAATSLTADGKACVGSKGSKGSASLGDSVREGRRRSERVCDGGMI